MLHFGKRKRKRKDPWLLKRETKPWARNTEAKSFRSAGAETASAKGSRGKKSIPVEESFIHNGPNIHAIPSNA